MGSFRFEIKASGLKVQDVKQKGARLESFYGFSLKLELFRALGIFLSPLLSEELSLELRRALFSLWS